MEKLVVNEGEEGLRLDITLANKFDNLSRSQISSLIKEGHILVNGGSVKPSFILSSGDEIEYEIVEKENTLKKENIDLDIIYEDDDIAIINKPQGMVTHPGVSNEEHTLANAIAYHFNSLSDINGELRPGIVHRIDKDTSGLICIAKNDYAHMELSKQLEDHTMRRKYYALVRGVVKENKAKIDLPIGKDKTNPTRQAVSRDGKYAVTNFEVVHRFATHTLLSCELETGRTHQIRVHLQYIGYPVESDPLYGEKNVKPLNPNGQMLHAYELTLIHPRTKKEMTFNAPLPAYFMKILKKLS